MTLLIVPWDKNAKQEMVFWKYAANLQRTKYAANLQETSMPKCDFNKVAKQLYQNHTSAWVPSINLLHIFRTPFLERFYPGSRAIPPWIIAPRTIAPPKCDFNKVAKQLYWNHTSAWVSSVNLLHIFITPILKNTSRRLLLSRLTIKYQTAYIFSNY